MAAISGNKVSREEAQAQLEKRPLSAKQEMLAQHLATTHDLKEAARQAGYKHGSARNLSMDPRIQERVRQINEATVERLGVSADELIQEIAALAFSDITEVIQVDYNRLQDLPRHVRAAIAEVKVRHNYDRDGFLSHTDCWIKMHNKVEAQRLLASITDPKPTVPGGTDEGAWTGLTVITEPPKRVNGSGNDG